MNTLTQTIAISKEAVAEMPVVECPVDITVVDTPELARVALRELTRARVVGFDTETRPSFQKGRTFNVALMQLSTEEHCYLFRLNRLGISEHMRHFLEDPEIIKIGLSVHDDFSVMRRLVSDLYPQGFIDLQEYVKYFHINDISLQKIYAIVYGMKISKNQRLTNWEADVLTEQQQKYAAIDAWACLRLYRTFRTGQFHPDESPYVVDRSMLNPAQNNQLIGPHQAAEQAKAAEEREHKAHAASPSKAKDDATAPAEKKSRRGRKPKSAAHLVSTESQEPKPARRAKAEKTPKAEKLAKSKKTAKADKSAKAERPSKKAKAEKPAEEKAAPKPPQKRAPRKKASPEADNNNPSQQS